jgi:hypothetical protein
VTWGNVQTKTGIDPRSYVAIWSVDYPNNNVPWPGNSGVTTQVKLSKGYYLAEGFTVPDSGYPTTPIAWSFAGVGANSNESFSISVCPGDFGQTGTQLAPGCSTPSGQSLGGQRVTVDGTSGCVVMPGQTYYLNILPQANLPVDDVAEQTINSSYPIRPWIGRN